VIVPDENFTLVVAGLAGCLLVSGVGIPPPLFISKSFSIHLFTACHTVQNRHGKRVTAKFA
jgi:hypothetical protein